MRTHQPSRPSLRLLGFTLGSLIVLAGCTTGEDEPSPAQDSASPVATELEQQPVVSDDDSFPPGQTGELVPSVYATLGTPTPEQQYTLDLARYTFIETCMKDQGFELVDAPPTRDVPPQPPVLFDGYIGILDADYARTNGYQLNLDDIEQPYQYDIGKNQDPPSKEYEFAFKVANGGGCLARADQALNQGRPSEDQSTPLLGKIYQDSLEATYADPDYKQAVTSWSTCMKDAGYDYATPRDAFSAYDGFQLTGESALRMRRESASNEGPHPSAAEAETALADVDCKRSSRIADVFRRVFWNEQVAMANTKDSRATLAVLDQVTDHLLANAKRMMKDSKG